LVKQGFKPENAVLPELTRAIEVGAPAARGE